jgi:hypothetical protein
MQVEKPPTVGIAQNVHAHIRPLDLFSAGEVDLPNHGPL